MVKKLTKEAEQQLLNALTQVADMTNSGEDPNAAISKVASEMKIPHGHIQLMVNAYNTGRTTAQRRSSDDLWSKVAEFPLADAEVILDKMYPDKVKTAAETAQDTVISDEYSKSPSWIARRESAEKRAQKVDWKMVDPPTPYPKEDRTFFEARCQIKKAEQVAAQARHRAAYAFDVAVQAKEELKAYFKTAGCRPFQEVKANAIRLHGEEVGPLFTQLEREVPSLTKQASTKNARFAPAVGRPYALVQACVESLEAYRQLREDHTEKAAALERVQKEMMRPFEKGPKLDPVLGLPVSASAKGQEAGSSSEKTGGFLDSLFGQNPKRTAGSAIGSLGSAVTLPYRMHFSPFGVATNDAYRSSLKTVQETGMADSVKKQLIPKEPEADLDHETAMDALHQESTLSDLMANDEVLSRRNPHELLDAYSSIRGLAPRAAANKELLRSLLRDRMEKGTQGIFDLDTIVKIEKNLQQLERNSRGGGGRDDDEK